MSCLSGALVFRKKQVKGIPWAFPLLGQKQHLSCKACESFLLKWWRKENMIFSSRQMALVEWFPSLGKRSSGFMVWWKDKYEGWCWLFCLVKRRPQNLEKIGAMQRWFLHTPNLHSAPNIPKNICSFQSAPNIPKYICKGTVILCNIRANIVLQLCCQMYEMACKERSKYARKYQSMWEIRANIGGNNCGAGKLFRWPAGFFYAHKWLHTGRYWKLFGSYICCFFYTRMPSYLMISAKCCNYWNI